MIKIRLEPDAIAQAVSRVQERIRANIPLSLELGADMVAAEAKQNHNYIDRSTDLTNSIAKDEVQPLGSGFSITVSAGAPYGVIIELGTKKKNYPIRPRFRKWLRFPGAGGGFAFSKGVIHPGITGRRFLANALEAKEPGVRSAVDDATALSFAQAGFQVKR